MRFNIAPLEGKLLWSGTGMRLVSAAAYITLPFEGSELASSRRVTRQ